jgi:hypothetical protein
MIRSLLNWLFPEKMPFGFMAPVLLQPARRDARARS